MVTDWFNKKKINERIKEHKRDNGREKSTIAKIALNNKININCNKTKKLAIYNNRNYAYCCESTKIISNFTLWAKIIQDFLSNLSKTEMHK